MKRRLTEEELPNDTSNVRAGLDQPFEVGGEMLTTVQAVL
jgi:hypothetical protein